MPLIDRPPANMERVRMASPLRAGSKCPRSGPQPAGFSSVKKMASFAPIHAAEEYPRKTRAGAECSFDQRKPKPSHGWESVHPQYDKISDHFIRQKGICQFSQEMNEPSSPIVCACRSVSKYSDCAIMRPQWTRHHTACLRKMLCNSATVCKASSIFLRRVTRTGKSKMGAASSTRV